MANWGSVGTLVELYVGGSYVPTHNNPTVDYGNVGSDPEYYPTLGSISFIANPVLGFVDDPGHFIGQQ